MLVPLAFDNPPRHEKLLVTGDVDFVNRNRTKMIGDNIGDKYVLAGVIIPIASPYDSVLALLKTTVLYYHHPADSICGRT